MSFSRAKGVVNTVAVSRPVSMSKACPASLFRPQRYSYEGTASMLRIAAQERKIALFESGL
jgi:hypothetical protein